jgi:hypothetical protein
MAYRTVHAEVDVDVDLSDFETDDLIEELELRGELPYSTGPYDSNELVQKIWMLRRNGKDYQTLLDDLIYAVTGRVV